MSSRKERYITAAFQAARKHLAEGTPVPSIFLAVSDREERIDMPVNPNSPDFPEKVREYQDLLTSSGATEYIFVSKIAYLVMIRPVDDTPLPKTAEEALELFGGLPPTEHPDRVEAVQVIYGSETESVAYVWDVVRDEKGNFLDLRLPREEVSHVHDGGSLGELLLQRRTTH